jgi:hypothetical protein
MMASVSVDLPDNLAACHAVICRQAEALDEQAARIEELLGHIDRLSRDLAAVKRQWFGSRRERFVSSGEGSAEEEVVIEQDPEGIPSAAKPPVDELGVGSSAATSRRTSKGRQKRVIDASIPREKVLHPLDEKNIPPEMLNDPRAKRFFRFVREEVELQERRVQIFEHYQEVIVLDDDAACDGDAAHPYAHFAFAAHKTEENVRRIVGDYEGYLQSDAYICYELVAAAPGSRIIPVGCWAHARRKFEPLIVAGPHPRATWILGEIQELYDIEDRARDMTDSQRLALRQAESRPIVTGIRAWLDERDRNELPKSPLREGVNYLRNRWEAFERFLEDGAIPIDNNRTEATIKGPVMGKKAWLFFGNENAGQTAAVLYTLTMSCKRHAIDVQAYLTDVLRRIRTATPAELESLLPDRWVAAHPEARLKQRVQESHAAAARKRQRRAQRRLSLRSG